MNTSIHICRDCNAFYYISNDNIVLYNLVCTEIDDNLNGNYIIEFDCESKKTNIKFLPINEELNSELIYTFNYLLPITPKNVAKKVKTYILFS